MNYYEINVSFKDLQMFHLLEVLCDKLKNSFPKAARAISLLHAKGTLSKIYLKAPLLWMLPKNFLLNKKKTLNRNDHNNKRTPNPTSWTASYPPSALSVTKLTWEHAPVWQRSTIQLPLSMLQRNLLMLILPTSILLCSNICGFDSWVAGMLEVVKLSSIRNTGNKFSTKTPFIPARIIKRDSYQRIFNFTRTHRSFGTFI